MNIRSRPTQTSGLIRGTVAVAVVVVAVTAFLTTSAGVVPASSPIAQHAPAGPAALAAAFVPNAGQSDAAVRFELRAPDSTLFVTSSGVVHVNRSGDLRLTFVGANPKPDVTGVQRLPGTVNYFRGNDPAAWQRGLSRYVAVRYRDLYPGIDARLDVRPGSTTAWASTIYAVAPGADPGRIRWRYDGARGVAIDPVTRALQVTLDGEALAGIVESAPRAWQDVAGRRVPVTVRYRIAYDRTVGFAVGRYDRGRALVIAPAQRRAPQAAAASFGYSTYLGGSKWDEAYDVKADAGGNALVAGFTFSPDFPTANARQAAFAGVVDAFVTKLNASGSALVYSTYLGGTKTDVGAGIAVDTSGNAYVAGRTESEDFPTTADAFQRRLRGFECQRARRHERAVPCHDAFVAKLSPTGGLVYSTLFGGSQTDEALSVAVDSAGAAYITGNTESSNLPTKAAVQEKFAPVPCVAQAPCPSDAFVTKLNPGGSGLVYSTYLGGKLGERASGVSVAKDGSAVVTGTTRSLDFPTKNAQQPKIGGTGSECGPPPVQCPDAYVAKLGPAGSELVYSTYLGGSKPDGGGGISADRAGNAYVTGSTRSTDFPTRNPIQATLDNSACNPPGVGPELCDDVFVTKLSASGTTVYSTYLSGRADDQGLGIAVNDAGEAYVTGSTSSTNFRQVNPAQPKFGGYIDGFLTKLNASGSAIDFSTFIGGSKADRGSGVAVDPSGNGYVAGRTISADFPTTPGAFQQALRGDIDGFVARLK